MSILILNILIFFYVMTDSWPGESPCHEAHKLILFAVNYAAYFIGNKAIWVALLFLYMPEKALVSCWYGESSGGIRVGHETIRFRIVSRTFPRTCFYFSNRAKFSGLNNILFSRNWCHFHYIIIFSYREIWHEWPRTII